MEQEEGEPGRGELSMVAEGSGGRRAWTVQHSWGGGLGLGAVRVDEGGHGELGRGAHTGHRQ